MTILRSLAALILIACLPSCVGEGEASSDGGESTANARASESELPDMREPDAVGSVSAGSVNAETAMTDSSDTDSSQPADAGNAPRSEVATFGAGCFWCVEAVLEQADGVYDVTSGYMGGTVDNPTYEMICTGTTGHAEVVQVRFNPDLLSFKALVKWFWKAHDPTQLNRQGADVGTQYRSAIFYHSDEQRQIAEESRKAEDASGDHLRPIVTEISPASTFYAAEDYHQDFYRQNRQHGYCRAVIAPKLDKLGLDK